MTKLFLVINLVFPLALVLIGFGGFAKWVGGGAQPEDSLVWVALAIAGLGWAATHFVGFIRPIHRELADSESTR